MLRLYDNLSSGNAYKVRLLITLLGRLFERVEMDIDRGATRTASFLALNPDGRIPLLILDNGKPLAQSNAILMYLAEGTRYLPNDRYARALVLQWLFFEQYSHEPNIATPRYWATHGIEMTPERTLALVQKRKAGIAALEVMERHLEHNRWFVPNAFSIADIALYAYTHVAAEGGFDLNPYPALRRWLTEIACLDRYVPITHDFPDNTITQGDGMNER